MRNTLTNAGISGEFAVMHPSPKFAYKTWTHEGWRETGRWLAARGLQLVLTGGPDAEERACVAAIAQAHADTGGFLVLTQDDSPWHAEHLFAVDKDVPGADMVRLSGTFVTKVFEGPYAEAKTWCGEMARVVQHRGKHLDALYFFYTTCPRCAKAYGRNYVVGVARVS